MIGQAYKQKNRLQLIYLDMHIYIFINSNLCFSELSKYQGNHTKLKKFHLGDNIFARMISNILTQKFVVKELVYYFDWFV